VRQSLERTGEKERRIDGLSSRLLKKASSKAAGSGDPALSPVAIEEQRVPGT